MLPSGCLLTILFLFSSFDFAHPRKSYRKSNNHSWDVLIFIQQWPRTGCEQWMQWKPSNKCSIPLTPNLWNVHGIWPSKYRSFGPYYCNRSAEFDLAAVKPIEKELSGIWSTYKYGSPNHSLWAHEWAKHGTCAAVLEHLNTEFKYLNRGIEYYKKYNLTNILTKADIVPTFNKGYDVLDIVNAIRNRLGVNPIVKCREKNGKSRLFEIGVCFSKELKICDCDGVLYDKVIGTSDVLTNCNRNYPVRYEPYRFSSSNF